jgi:hypothetical protein
MAGWRTSWTIWTSPNNIRRSLEQSKIGKYFHINNYSCFITGIASLTIANGPTPHGTGSFGNIP